MTYKWGNADHTALTEVYGNGRVRVIDQGTEHDLIVSDEAIEPFQLPIILQCSPAQMRLTLHRAGLLATVQAIADGDPEASIVWEYATMIVRDSPFILALEAQSGLTGAEIDALFAAAMLS